MPHALRALLLAGLATCTLATGCRHSSFPNYPESYREFAYVANTAANTVSVLDLVYLRPDRTLQVGVAPVALASNPDPQRNEVYVVNSQPNSGSGSLSVIDTIRNEVAGTIPLGRNPATISVTQDGLRAYIANTGSNNLTVIDLVSRRPLETVPTGERPDSAVISNDGRTLVVANHGSGTVSVFAAGAPGSSAPALKLRQTFSGCPGAASAVILPDASKAFIACSSGHQVMALSLAAAPDSWNAKQDATLLSDRLLALLDVGEQPQHLTLKPDGGEIFVSNAKSDTMSEIATTTNEVGSTYAIGNRPAHAVVSADNVTLWVSNSGADSLSLYSIEDGKLLTGLHVGGTPDALAFSADEHLLLVADKGSGDVALIRTAGKPSLFTMMPAGSSPSAIVIRAMQKKS